MEITHLFLIVYLNGIGDDISANAFFCYSSIQFYDIVNV